MICVDANVLIAALDARDAHHLAASALLVEHAPAVSLNITIAEALIHPTRAGQGDVARSLLDGYGVRSTVVTDEVADVATTLRAIHGNRNFPLLDALVVAHGLVNDLPVATADAKWPDIAGVEIALLHE